MSEEDNAKLFVVFLLVVLSLWGNWIRLNKIDELEKMIIEVSAQKQECEGVNHD